jgi:hypothetical protein
MHARQVLRFMGLAVVWAMAVSTWASIGHHLLGVPDMGLLLVIVSVFMTLGWPVRRVLLSRATSGIPAHLKTPDAATRA